MTRRRRPRRSSRPVWPLLLLGAAAVAASVGGWHVATGGVVSPAALVQPSIVGTWVADDGVALRFTSDGQVFEGLWTGEEFKPFPEPWDYRRVDGRYEYGEKLIRKLYMEDGRLRLLTGDRRSSGVLRKL